jgi:hypothetical protein
MGNRPRAALREPKADKNIIWEAFQYDKSLAKQDCLDLTPSRAARRSLDDTRMTLIEKSPLLRGWLGLNRPCLLLLNGRSRLRQRSEVSAVLARTCLELVDHAKETHILITLCFFCGRHAGADDSLGNANEIVLNLLSQLIEHYDGFTSDDLQECLKDTEPEQAESVAASFRKLIEKLPGDYIVVIVIDGLNFFATPMDRQEETRIVVEQLTNIWRARPAAMLKMLFATPTHAEFVEDLFQSDETLNMPREVRRTGGRKERRSRSSLSSELTGIFDETDSSTVE